MSFSGLRSLIVLFCAALVAALATPGFAQSGGDAKPTDPKAGDAKRSDEMIAEAARMVSGPAGNPECVWLGERVVNLLSRDDLDTAFRHLDLYDRFGCPGAHIQVSFRCLVRQKPPDPKDAVTLETRVHNCWISPNATPAPAAPAAASAAPAAGTNAR